MSTVENKGVQSRWIQHGEADYECPSCGFRFTSADPIELFKYCRCGAMMHTGFVKTEELCNSCVYSFDTYCRCYGCSTCSMLNNTPPGRCKCLDIKNGELCPYYIERDLDER